MGIKNRLNALLDEKNMNANELAVKMGAAPSTIYSILQRDSTRIDIDLILKIAHCLGVTADELLSDELKAAHKEQPSDSMKASLNKYYDSFNSEGREKLLSYARDLDETGKYKGDSRSKDIG